MNSPAAPSKAITVDEIENARVHFLALWPEAMDSMNGLCDLALKGLASSEIPFNAALSMGPKLLELSQNSRDIANAIWEDGWDASALSILEFCDLADDVAKAVMDIAPSSSPERSKP